MRLIVSGLICTAEDAIVPGDAVAVMCCRHVLCACHLYAGLGTVLRM